MAEDTGKCEPFARAANEEYSVSPFATGALADLMSSADPDGGEGDVDATYLLKLQYDVDERVAYFAGIETERLEAKQHRYL